jgi:uracil-DNA glycosylase
LLEIQTMEIPKSWRLFLQEEMQKSYFLELQNFLEKEYQEFICFPPKEVIFSAFEKCSLENLKVVIIGQDPYHGEKEANGLCFSVNAGVAIPPSLRNIFREVSADFDTILQPNSGNLEHWATQGVLLLNATLTVRKDQPNSHKNLSWQRFTDAVIEKIATEREHIVFLLWGSFAQKKGVKIDRNKHLVLTSGHPSPLSANQGKWFGNKHFSTTNVYLQSHHKKPIVWFTV